MKKLVLITYESIAKERYIAQLINFFGSVIEIKGYSVVDEELTEVVEADLILISFADVTGYINQYLPENADIIYITRTFLKDDIKPLNEIAPMQDVLLVDYSKITAYETLGILHEIGYKNVNFILIYPELSADASGFMADIAVTPGYAEYAPEGIKRIINIGWYSVSLLTLADIINKLGLKDSIFEEKLFRYSKEVVPTNTGLVNAIKSTWEIQNQWNTILNIMDDGVIVMDPDNNPVYENRFIKNMLKEFEWRDPAFSEFWNLVKGSPDIQDVHIKISRLNKSFLISKKEVNIYGELFGYILILKDVTKIQELENKLRSQQARSGLKAQYTFDQIITNSEIMIKTIENAKKIARTDYSVLIAGETGVGKELFAQSVHNYSKRSFMPFVAINCAALPKELLESELFGYDEGSFTGARKGGKLGLFELAHKGSIFLDEIGELSLDVQAKLLRVLQEKEVMRIGGNTVIKIDVRIITASNACFEELIKERKFRKDLFYRLNIMNLKIPSLNERRRDINELAKYFLYQLTRGEKSMSQDLLLNLQNINWDGNVRELKNCMEYMSVMGDKILTDEDIPEYLKERIHDKNQNASEKNPDNLSGLLPDEREIAEAIIDSLKLRSLGRRRLYEVLKIQGLATSEYEIRNIIKLLEIKGIVRVNPGRRGIELL